MNKKITAVIIGILIIVGIAVAVIITLGNKKESDVNKNTPNDEVRDNSESNTFNDQMRIKITFQDKDLYVRLVDNELARDLITMLPLTVDFEDYNNTEKIASLPEKLELDKNPGKYSVEPGDFAYYAPWGNLSVFYKDFESSSSLQKLGEFENGIEELKNLEGKAIIEIVNE